MVVSLNGKIGRNATERVVLETILGHGNVTIHHHNIMATRVAVIPIK